ncbi:MAG: Lon-like protease [Actinomycetota bacterium]|nr:Lon-like protease [Actinomycetota bacterium]
MSRRTASLSVAAILIVVLAALATFLPVPYVLLSPGPSTNTLGSVGKQPLIRILGHQTYPTTGHLNLTTVSVLGGPQQRMDLVSAIRGWIDKDTAVVPEEQVYPKGQTADEAVKEGEAEMKQSQEDATTAALRQLGFRITTSVVVDRLSKGSAATGILKPGDVVQEIDGKPVQGGARLRQLITAHKPGDTVRMVVLRAGKRLSVSMTTKKAADGSTIIGVFSRDAAKYPFTVEVSLRQVGGPSAGLMFALGIVDKLTPGALTGGMFVAGTGTIDDQGQVGEIGGIPQKMRGARHAGATVFLAPAGNCAEARATVPKGLRLVKVSTLREAMADLDKLRAGDTNVPRC